MNKDKEKLDNKLNFAFIIFFILYFIFFTQIKIFISPISDSFFSKINFQNTFMFNTLNSVKNYFTDKSILIKENEDLKKDIENKNLRLLNLENNDPSNTSIISSNYISTKILNKDYFGIYDEIILDKGFIDGVNLDDEVYISPNYYLGKISRIERDISILSPTSKSGTKIKGILKVDDIENSSSSKEIVLDLNGIGGGDFYFEIPNSINIATNSVVYLATDESKELGTIASSENMESSLYKKVLVMGYYNTNKQEKYYIKIK
jgi:hypothetical protein